eukprot:TRINITY_DN23953_c0_g1_i1.p1 TRINITY_DN23953_c0_g1~~TRINITY_DN23953_c0_g1_i1.p1  ORF type:complete len:225 (+),score=6.64 TRINITY_DN23953_c0_g1_i1:57-731(+)
MASLLSSQLSGHSSLEFRISLSSFVGGSNLSLPYFPTWSRPPSNIVTHPTTSRGIRTSIVGCLSCAESQRNALKCALGSAVSGPIKEKSPNIFTESSVRDSLLRCCISSTSSLLFSAWLSLALIGQSAPLSDSTFENVPQSLSGGDVQGPRIQRPKTREAETCTRKCVATCIRGGAGAPGEGPLNVNRPLVVFKEGFRTRQYCLVECSDLCNIIASETPESRGR